MKKLINVSMGYAIAGMVCGVFYREFTKFNGFTGRTALAVVHTHLFMLGMMFFLVAGLFALNTEVMKQKRFRSFFVTYNIGVIMTTIMLLVRGVVQVLGISLEKGPNAAISGIAGIGHIFTGIGIILFFLCLKSCVKDKSLQ